MKKVLLPAMALMLALTACASNQNASSQENTPKTETNAAPTTETTQNKASETQDVTIDRRQEVAYACSPKGANKLTVMYGLKGQDVIAAQVKFQDKLSPVLFLDHRVTDRNIFTSDSGIVWMTEKTNANQLNKVKAFGLGQPGKRMVEGKETIVTNVVVADCQVDKKATAALNKSAAKKPVKAKKSHK